MSNPISSSSSKGLGLLDKLPPVVRHAALLGMSWVVANGANSVAHLHLSQSQSTAAGAGLSLALMIFTPLTRQYGVGK